MKSILIKRSGALGDVILTTPVLRRLRQENPDAHIAVHTAYPDVFSRNPHLNSLNQPISLPDITITLDLAYEKHPRMHIVEAYMREAFDDSGHGKCNMRQELFFTPYKKLLVNGRGVAVHAAVAGWSNRTFPRELWAEVIAKLQEKDFFVFLVGTSRDNGDIQTGQKIVNAFNVPFLSQTALIDACACFVGSDSALMHAAGATKAPIVGLFSCAYPDWRMPLSHPAPMKAIMNSELPCIGCLHYRSPPVTTEFCNRGDNACVQNISADRIVEAVIFLIDKNKHSIENRRQTGV